MMKTWVEVARRVVAERQYQCVDTTTNDIAPEDNDKGIILDMQTAYLLITVHDSLGLPANREKFASMRLDEAASLAWKLVK